MPEVAKKHSDRLEEFKKYIEDSRDYFCENIERFNQFKKYVFKSSLTDNQVATLNELGKPTTEFNILEAYVSRLRGEFSRQEPSISVRAADGLPVSALSDEFIDTLEVLEAHLRAVFHDAENDKLQYNVFSDLLSGGFSVMRVETDYVNEMSFEQKIDVSHVFDVTLTGFDPLARESHKGDGRFCFEIYPLTKDEFEKEYGKNACKGLKFARNIEGFSWSYKNEKESIIMVADLYVKEEVKTKIVRLSNGYTVTKKEYNQFIEEWEAQGFIEQPPIILDERTTYITKIWRYRLCENQILDATETSFKMLPLVFVDGNSVMLNESGYTYQMTRPYVYHAKGIQDLKNYAGQTLANELESMIQHKFIVPVESVPSDYEDVYRDVQKADVLLYNHYHKNNPEQVLPPPREIVRTPIPPQISETFQVSDQMTQMILGNYDASAGVARSDMSGVAFARSAMQSNNASMPYIVGYIKGLNRVAQIIIDLIPKFYRTPRTLPVIMPDGSREYVAINKQDTLYMNYDPNSLQVKVEAGVNFAIQKEIALQTIVNLMQASELFAQFINQEGLQILLDNIEIRGIDALKQKVEKFEETIAQQQQMAQQQQQAQLAAEQQKAQMAMVEMQKELASPTQGQLGVMALEQQAQRDQEKAAIDAAKVSIDAQEADAKYLETMAKVQNMAVDNDLQAAKISAENQRSAVDAAINLSKHINDEA